jgi:clan AA aspartic protease
MRIDGYFNSRNEPVVKLDVGSLSIEMLVDTGFDGSLILPGDLAEKMDLEFEGNEEFCSVTGAPFDVSTCVMEIDWLGKTIRVPLAKTSSVTEALLGSHMLKNCRLTIDYGNRTVIKSKLY